MIKIDIALR